MTEFKDGALSIELRGGRVGSIPFVDMLTG